jgi:hypothetical protein
LPAVELFPAALAVMTAPLVVFVCEAMVTAPPAERLLATVAVVVSVATFNPIVAPVWTPDPAAFASPEPVDEPSWVAVIATLPVSSRGLPGGVPSRALVVLLTMAIATAGLTRPCWPPSSPPRPSSRRSGCPWRSG